MGWQDDPVIEESATASQPSWMSDPEVDGGDQPPQEPPSTAAVALNAVPKGIANFLHTPNMINSLILRGVSSIPGMENVPGIKEMADRFAQNGVMDFMKQHGVVKPENEPQTPVQRVIDTAIQSAVQAAAVPVGGALNMAKNAVMGAIGGTSSGVTKELTGSDLLAGVMGVAAPLAAGAVANKITQSSKVINLNQTEQQTLRRAQQYGLAVEPSRVRGPSSLKESFAGKAALSQETSLKNQPIFNGMASQYVGLPKNTPLSKGVLDAYKQTIAKPFEEVDQVFNQLKQNNKLPYFPRYHSQSLMDEYREAADHARALWRQYTTAPTKDITILKAAKAADTATDAVFKDIAMVAQTAGDPKLINRLMNARKLYARVSDVQAATNVGSGNIDAAAVGRMLQDGKKFEGELRDMGQFAQAFKRSARPIESIPPPGVSGGDLAMGPVIGAAAGDLKSGVLAFGIPGLRDKARKHVLSDLYQSELLKTPSPIRKQLQVPKSAARIGAASAGKTAYDNAEE